MDTDRVALDDLTILRSAFENGTSLGWEAVHAFEKQHGIVLPEPYRTFVAEVTDSPIAGPPFCGMVKLGSLPKDWGDGRSERDLTKPFPLTEAWVWEDDERSCEEVGPLLEPVYEHGSLVLGSDGCGMYWHLIVTGPHRGHVGRLGFPIPGQQLIQIVDLVIGDAREHVGKPSLRIDVIEFCGLDQRVHHCGALAVVSSPWIRSAANT
jgi:hypothetical protein